MRNIWPALRQIAFVKKECFDMLNVILTFRRIAIAYMIGFVFVDAASASPVIGSNLPLGGWTKEYQGSPNSAVDINDSRRVLVAATSAQASSSSNSICNAQAPSNIALNATAQLYATNDQGTTWVRRCAPWQTMVSSGVQNANLFFQTAPAVAYKKDGTAIAAYVQGSTALATGATGTAVVLAQSIDNGSTWLPASSVIDYFGLENVVYSNTKLAVDYSSGGAYSHPGRTYVAAIRGATMAPISTSWPGIDTNLTSMQYTTGSVEIFFSDNYNPGSWTGRRLPAMWGAADGVNIAVGRDGTVYATWNVVDSSGFCSYPDSTFISTSKDGGLSWSLPNKIIDHKMCAIKADATPVSPDPSAQYQRRPPSFMQIDIDRSPASPFVDRIYAIYNDLSDSGRDYDVFMVSSTDGGATWSSPLRVNDDVGVTNQLLPTLAVDQSDGSVNMSWYDSRDFTGSTKYINSYYNGIPLYSVTPDPRIRIYYARSVDGGVTVEKNVLITDNGRSLTLANFVNPISFSDEFSPHWNYDKISTDPDLFGRLFQYGDFIGMIAANRQVMPFWTDTRNFYPQTSPSGKYDEDIATALITQCSPPTWSAQLTLTKQSNGVVLWWPPVSSWGTNGGSGQFKIYRSDGSPLGGSSSQSKLIGTTTALTYTDTNVPAGGHYYKVVAINNCIGTSMTPMSVSTVPQYVVTP